MHLSDRAIEFPRLVLLTAVSVCMLGVVGVLTIPNERTPRIKIPIVIVAIPNPGATPATNENQIVDKIEEEVENSLTNLKDRGAILSQAMNGAVVVHFVFDDDIDPTEAKRDVESLINKVKGQFPIGAQQDPGPIVDEVAFEDLPIIEVVIRGGQDGWHRRRVADEFKKKIERVSGIAGVDIFGGLEREVQVGLNPHLMTLYGFSYEQVETAIRRANMEAPSGSIDSAKGFDQRVLSQTKLDSIDAIRRVTLGTRDDKPIILSDIAEVYVGHEPLKSLARYDGEDAVVLLVRSKLDVDVLWASDEIQKLVDQYASEQDGAGGIQISAVRSQSREIGWMLEQLITSALYGMVLVGILLWVAMGWRNAGLIGLAVPFALLGGAAIMWIARRTIMPDLSINNMTLFGGILVIGMLVDGAIIVGENIFRHRELGRSPVESAKRGINEVGGSLVSAYLTTFAAFMPMLMISGLMGQFLRQLPIVVLFALCSAALVDHFLLPVFSIYVMKSPGKKGLQKLESGANASSNAVEIELTHTESEATNSRVKRIYGDMLSYSLRHRLMVLGLAITVVAAPVLLFMVGAIGVEFFPDSDIPIVEVYFELPLGSSMEKRTVQVAQEIEHAVMKAVRPEEWYRSPKGELARPVTTIGDPGALATNFGPIDQGTGPEFGMVYVELALAEDRQRSSIEIRQAILNALPPLPGVIVRVTSPKDGPPVGAEVVVRVLARPNSSIPLDQMARHADEVHRLLESIPGTYDVISDYRLRNEIAVTPNRTVASLFGVDANQIATSVNYALDGVRVGEVDFGGSEEIDIRLRNQLSEREELEDLENLPLLSPDGKVVALSQVSQIERGRGANVIRHYDQQRVVNVRCGLEEGVLTDDVRTALAKALQADRDRSFRTATLPGGSQSVIYSDEQVVIDFGGETEERDNAMGDLHIALLVASAAMMIILTIKFNSFIQPLIVLFSVPLSLVGVSIGLMLCGFHFSVASMIGVVALAGIVVNDAIVLVDFINQLRNEGLPMDQAVVQAGQMRLRPIFLTTVTTIGGLLPLGLNLAGGGEFFQPLTVTIMFGLGFATLLQLFVIPLACYTFSYRNSLFDPVQNQRPETPGGVVMPSNATI